MVCNQCATPAIGLNVMTDTLVFAVEPGNMVQIPVFAGFAHRVDCLDCGKTLLYVTLGSNVKGKDNVCEYCYEARYFPNRGKRDD